MLLTFTHPFHKLTEGIIQSLFSPLVQKLGYEYSPEDSTDIRELRTLAITQAASAEDESYSYFLSYTGTEKD